MPIDAQNPNAVTNPEIPYDKVIYSFDVLTRIAGGQLRPLVQIRLQRARQLPAAGDAEQWEPDPNCPEQLKVYGDLAALVADLPEDVRPLVATVNEELNTIVAAINAKHKLV
jgi:hypothetical protein